ncbi:Spy/CpxP family protein refolding chaperone [Ferrovibrio sp.]|uniref:Spy/CpxP family protein refolding chaperone n=2 Tax=Ferrovibrio sp. TaxID=1917215 RepID=UPI0035119022
MIKSRPLLAAALMATSLGTAGLAAGLPSAQAQPARAQSSPAADAQPGQPARPHANRAMPGQFIEGRIAFLQTELKLTATQQPLFDRLAGEMRAGAKDMQARMTAVRADRPDSSVERMERRTMLMKAALADSERFLAAYKPLYGALSPEQRKTADLLFARMGGGMGSMMGGPGHDMRKH